MLQRLEKKIATTINMFFLFGLISVGLGFLTLTNELFARLFVALSFFLLGLLFLHISYHIQDLRNRLAEVINHLEKPVIEPIVNAVKAAEKKIVQRKRSSRKRFS